MNTDILKKYRAHYKVLGFDNADFTEDGILNDTEFENAPKRLLFLLKDSNDFGGGSLAKLLADGPKYQMWHALARWAGGILYGFDLNERKKREDMKRALRQVAVVNVKKMTGSSSIHHHRLSDFVHLDGELLKEQIKRIRPDLIVACGTFHACKGLLNIRKKDIVEMMKNQNSWVAHSEEFNCPVIDWYHPSRHGGERFFNALEECFDKHPALLAWKNAR